MFYPDTRTVSVYRAGGKAARLGAGETLSDAEVLPGFTCLVADVFPRQPAAPALGLRLTNPPSVARGFLRLRIHLKLGTRFGSCALSLVRPPRYHRWSR